MYETADESTYNGHEKKLRTLCLSWGTINIRARLKTIEALYVVIWATSKLSSKASYVPWDILSSFESRTTLVFSSLPQLQETMVQIKPFQVEQWMDRFETTPGVINIAETCAASVSINDLARLSTQPAGPGPLDTSVKLTYGPILGSQLLREQVAAHCSTEKSRLTADSIIITQGAIGANFLALYSLLGPGDHVVCVYPTYQQLYDVPRSIGAEVSLWRLRKEDGFVPNLADLESLIKANTKVPTSTYLTVSSLRYSCRMIIINNPNNPTGVPIPTSVVQRISKVAEERGIILFSDEVYRPLFHGGVQGKGGVPVPATALDYEKTVVTGSMSKGYALAGIRIGWIATKDKAIMSALVSARDYTTISVSQLDDQIASYALSPEVRGPLIDRNTELAKTNLKLLKTFVDNHSAVCSWVEPTAGTTAFIQFMNKGEAVNDVEFCIDLLEKTKVFICPGSHCFGSDEDFQGYVRLGYVCETDVLKEGLEKLGIYVGKHLVTRGPWLIQCEYWMHLERMRMSGSSQSRRRQLEKLVKVLIGARKPETRDATKVHVPSTFKLRLIRVMKPNASGVCLVAILAGVKSQVVQWDVERRHATPGLGRRVLSTFEEVVANSKGSGGYFATVEIGSPGQNLTLQLDTGSSDVWVPWCNATICTSAESSAEGCTFGCFSPDSSKSFDDIGQGSFTISYVDDDYSKGDYFTDIFKIGGAKVENLTMGLGMKTSISYGLAGVGYAVNEASTDTPGSSVYPNLPVAMYEAGSINTIAYSLWLNDLSASTGSILFGGIDTEKYLGELTRIRVLPQDPDNSYVHFNVALTSLLATSPTGTDTLTSSSFPITAVLDSGTTLSYLPQDVATQMWDEVGAVFESSVNLAVLPCSYADHEGHFSFGFAGPDGPRINITMDELVVDLTNGRMPQFTSGQWKGQLACEFGIQNSSSGSVILGDTFLRSAYVVYDLVNNEIGLARTNFNSTDSNIVAFESQGAHIPSATMAPDQDATQTAEVAQTDFKAAKGFQAGSGDTDPDSASPGRDASPTLMVVGIALMFMFLKDCIF
ncbi:hypothetical protein G7046_g880 [Stylonectria norvegica]|nr:hypothetical protein G7046_g880 [Stylonectria norvegica]